MIEFLATTPVLVMTSILLVIIGGFVLSRGLVNRHKLKNWVPHTARLHLISKRSLAAGLSWSWMGNDFSSSIPYLYSFTRGEEIGILVNPTTHGQFQLDVWSHNGKLQVFGGLLILAAGIALAVIAYLGM